MTLVAVSVIIFWATVALPGDSASAILEREAADPTIAGPLRERLGLNRPLHEQYVDWFSGALHGSFGESYALGQPVTRILRPTLRNSLTLAGITIIIVVPLSLLLGTIAAARAGSLVDRTISAPTLFLISLPEFVVAAVLIVIFAGWLGVLPPVALLGPGEAPLESPTKLVLPVLTLVVGMLGQTTRMVRASVIEVLEQEYVQMARLKGVPNRRLLRLHVLRNALVPSVQLFALYLAALIGGLVITETIFNYPGVGSLLVSSIRLQDTPMIQACAFVVATAYISMNIIADVTMRLLTPKLRTSETS